MNANGSAMEVAVALMVYVDQAVSFVLLLSSRSAPGCNPTVVYFVFCLTGMLHVMQTQGAHMVPILNELGTAVATVG